MKLVLLIVFSSSVYGFPQYATKIPNGKSVPNPGPQGGVWAGVGHLATGGGGELNPFGEDFAAAGHKWTTSLCQTDSDGDGRTNGEELGDPDCLWQEGIDPSGPALSHPGIADKPKTPTGDTCEGYKEPEDAVTMDIKFSAPTQIDETRTHYVCEQITVDVPDELMYHQIKTEVLLDNQDTLHHMFVFICEADTPSINGNRVDEGAYKCSGNESGCRRIAGWAVGPKHECLPPNVGEELDFRGKQNTVFKIEAHYDNTVGQPQQDQSGMRLTMTPTLRPLTGSGVMVGMTTFDSNFRVPHSQEAYPLTNICPSAITQDLPHPIYVYSFTPHMHYYGKTLVTEHYRCGKKIGEIGRIDDYEFDNQQTYTLPSPTKILPGDALVTTCEYDTTKIDFDVSGGEETTDEMCLNFLSIYPTTASEESPEIMFVCVSFENGLERDNMTIPFRFALGGATSDADRLAEGTGSDGIFSGIQDSTEQNSIRRGIGFATDFESDPTLSIGECCAADICEKLYLADIQEACGANNDCLDGLVCDGGLCQYPVEQISPNTDDIIGFSAAQRQALSRAAISLFFVIFLTANVF